MVNDLENPAFFWAITVADFTSSIRKIVILEDVYRSLDLS
jgi:hypothetical protein